MISLGMHARINTIESKLRKAGFAIQKLADITSLLWGKLVINAAINPLTALLRVTNGKLLDRPAIQELFVAAACEAAAVAAAQGINLPYPDPVLAVTEIARKTATNRSSMLQDLLRGTPSEIDVINGAIVQAGERVGVPTPVNQILWQLVRAAEDCNQDVV
jgi:2-dehydropantoate 2-reductase